ncbi:glucose-inhibited division protein A [Chryseobacterium sp. W4I1]|nr:glucose-inhibited division protein A [Chryseobacterium sp. W4I1]
MTEKAYQLGLAKEDRLRKVEIKVSESQKLEDFLRETSLKPGIINPILESIESNPVDQAYRASQFLTRPNITLEKLDAIDSIKEFSSQFDDEVREQAEINIKYKGYIEKEKENVAKLNRLENIKIPEDFDYKSISSLSLEAKQKMSNVRPKTIAQAGRISGVSPADINVLLVYLGR